MRIIAKGIKKDHALAMELWSSNLFFAKQLTILIIDKKLLTEEVIDQLIADMNQHNDHEKLQLIDWLFANQLSKDKKQLLSLKVGKTAIPLFKEQLIGTIRHVCVGQDKHLLPTPKSY